LNIQKNYFASKCLAAERTELCLKYYLIPNSFRDFYLINAYFKTVEIDLRNGFGVK
jgi:hypothetical protein